MIDSQALHLVGHGEGGFTDAIKISVAGMRFHLLHLLLDGRLTFRTQGRFLFFKASLDFMGLGFVYTKLFYVFKAGVFLHQLGRHFFQFLRTNGTCLLSVSHKTAGQTSGRSFDFVIAVFHGFLSTGMPLEELWFSGLKILRAFSRNFPLIFQQAETQLLTIQWHVSAKIYQVLLAWILRINFTHGRCELFLARF
jgi:hypothetical protein